MNLPCCWKTRGSTRIVLTIISTCELHNLEKHTHRTFWVFFLQVYEVKMWKKVEMLCNRTRNVFFFSQCRTMVKFVGKSRSDHLLFSSVDGYRLVLFRQIYNFTHSTSESIYIILYFLFYCRFTWHILFGYAFFIAGEMWNHGKTHVYVVWYSAKINYTINIYVVGYLSRCSRLAKTLLISFLDVGNRF